MSRDIPIIFSAAMVLALLSGRKTMTRRLAWGEYKEHPEIGQRLRKPSPWTKVVPGDRLWVRESVQAVVDAQDFDAVKYLADGLTKRSTADTQAEADRYQDQLFCYRARKNAPDSKTGVSVPSIHMPRWVSRLTLIVESVKAEPLHHLTEADALAEGIKYENVIIGSHGSTGTHVEINADRYFNGTEEDEFEGHESACGAFEDLWARLHGRRSWNENPEVVALSVRVVNANIDTTEARAA
jgi:hypothetical protein